MTKCTVYRRIRQQLWQKKKKKKSCWKRSIKCGRSNASKRILNYLKFYKHTQNAYMLVPINFSIPTCFHTTTATTITSLSPQLFFLRSNKTLLTKTSKYKGAIQSKQHNQPLKLQCLRNFNKEKKSNNCNPKFWGRLWILFL